MTRAAIPQAEPREQAARDCITAAYLPVDEPAYRPNRIVFIALMGLAAFAGICIAAATGPIP